MGAVNPPQIGENMENFNRLNMIKSYVNNGYIKRADKKIDEFYEDWTAGKIHLSKLEEDFMFFLLDEISTILYN